MLHSFLVTITFLVTVTFFQQLRKDTHTQLHKHTAQPEAAACEYDRSCCDARRVVFREKGIINLMRVVLKTIAFETVI